MHSFWLKDWWSGKGPLRSITLWMNKTARWCNNFTVEAPLVADPNTDGLRIWLDVENVLDHLWKVTFNADRDEFTVGAGWVYDGSTQHQKAAETFPLTTDTDVWLVVKYYNNPPTSSELTFVANTADEPEEDYQTDEVIGSEAASLTWSGWVQYVYRIATVSKAEKAAINYHLEPINQLGGLTVVRQVMTNLRYVNNGDGTGKFVRTYVSEVYVGGVLRSVSNPWDTDLLDTGPCPDETGGEEA